MHQEKIILGNLRLWAVNYLSEHSVIHKSNFQLLKEIGQRSPEENKEFDLLVKILKIFEKDEHTLELRIKDASNEMWCLTVGKLRFGSILRED